MPLKLINCMHGWHFSDEMIREALEGVRMINPSLDLGNPCNLNCHYCFVEQKATERKRRLPAELSDKETLSVINDFARAGSLTVNIVGAGEPMIDPLFPRVLREIARLGMVPVIFTHGAEIPRKPHLIDLLQETNATVVIKLNSRNRALQDAIVGRIGYAEQRDVAISLLLQAGFAESNPTRLAVDTLAFKGNLEELPDIHRWAREHNIFPITATFIPTGRTAGGSVSGSASFRVVDSMERIAAQYALNEINRDEADLLKMRLRSIDDEFCVSHAEGAAYFGGGACTQILGLYVDVLGRIWPCVARRQVGPNPSERPLGSVREGLMPSGVWTTHSYMAWLRRNYDGRCPYKGSNVTDVGQIIDEVQAER